MTAEGGGNAIGVGQADFTTQRLVSEFNAEATYANAIASGTPESGRLPVVLPTLDDAIRAALLTSSVGDWDKATIVRIQNTLQLDTIWVSDALAAAVAAHPHLRWAE